MKNLVILFSLVLLGWLFHQTIVNIDIQTKIIIRDTLSMIIHILIGVYIGYLIGLIEHKEID